MSDAEAFVATCPSDAPCITFSSGSPTASLPDDLFARFRHLRILTLSRIGLVNIPQSVVHCATLERLDVSHNLLQFIPVEVGLLPALQWLAITGNPVVEKLPLSSGATGHDVAALFRRVMTPVVPLLPLAWEGDDGAFSLVSYNILAPVGAVRSWFPLSPLSSLQTSVRRDLIRGELRRFNPDVILLQEVEVGLFPEWAAFLHDYSAFYLPKGRYWEAGTDRERVLGQATFVRSFRVLADSSWTKPRHDAALMVAVMGFGVGLVVTNIHLYWHPEGAKIRTSQLARAIGAAFDFGESTFSSVNIDYDIIVAGDFNMHPYAASAEPPGLGEEEFLRDVLSGFDLATAAEDKFTHFWRDFNDFDHIIATRSAIRVCGHLSGHDRAAFSARYCGLPAQGMPSDHIPVGARFVVLPPQRRRARPARLRTARPPPIVAERRAARSPLVIVRRRGDDN